MTDGQSPLAGSRRAGGRADDERSYAKTAKVGAVWGVGRQTVGQIIQLAGGIALARLLTPYDFGVAAAVAFFLRLGNKLSSVGFGSSLVRLKHMKPEHLSSVFVVSLGLGLTMWLALTMSAGVLAQYFHNDAVAPALRVAALIYLLLPFGVGQMAMFNRQLRFKPLAVIEWTYSSVFVVLSVTLAWFGFSYWSLIWGTLLANCASTLVRIYLGGVQPKLKFSRAAFNEVVPFGLGIQAKRILTFCAEYLDNLVVGRMLGLTALGFYDKAFSTVDRVVDRLAGAPNVFFRIFAIIQDDRERLRRAYRKSSTAVSLMGVPTFAVLIVLGPELIPFVYGDKWRFSIVPFQILCVAGACRTSMAYASAMVQAGGQIWSEIARLSLYVALVAVGAWLGAAYGIVGVAAAVAIANATMSVLMQSLVRKIAHVTTAELITCQLPAMGVSALLVAAMMASRMLLLAMHPAAHEWQVLGVKTVAAALAALCMFLRPPFAGLREIRDEVLTDLIPGVIRYLPSWAGVPAPKPADRPRRTAPAAMTAVNEHAPTL